VAQHQLVSPHVGLLPNKPLGTAKLPFI